MESAVSKLFLLVLISALILPGSLGVFAQVASSNPSSPIADTGGVLIVDGAATSPLNLSPTDIAAMPQTTVNSPLICEGVVIYSGGWTGVLIGTLLQEAGYYPGSSTLEFYASDGYNVNISVEAALVNGLILAYELNGQPLPSLRLVLPNDAGPYWIDQIAEMKITNSGNYNVEPPPDLSVAYSSTTPEPQVTPEPTNTPAPAITPAPSPSIQPSITPQQTQIPTVNVTTPPVSSPPTPSPTSPLQSISSPTQQINESNGSSPTVPPTGEQQSQPKAVTSSAISQNIYIIILLVAAIATALPVTAMVVLKRKKMT